MKISKELVLQSVRQSLSKPIDKNAILVLNDSSNRGDIYAVILSILRDEELGDKHIYLSVSDLSDVFVELDEARITYVKNGKLKFVEMLETAGLIITSAFLPDYYIKREAQKVICMYQVCNLTDKAISKNRSLYTRSVYMADYLHHDKSYLLNSIDWKLKINISNSICEFDNSDYNKYGVVVSLDDKTLGASFADYDRKIKDLKFELIPYNQEAAFYVSKRKFNQFKSENEPEALSICYDRSIPQCVLNKNARLLISTAMQDILNVIDDNIYCILIHKDPISVLRYLSEFEEDGRIGRFSLVATWDEALEVVKEKSLDLFAQTGEFADIVGRKLLGPNNKETLNKIIGWVKKCETGYVKTVEELFDNTLDELFVMKGADTAQFIPAFNNYKTDKKIGILARSEKKLFNDVIALDYGRAFFCRYGTTYEEDCGRNPDTYKKEWKRIIGECHPKRLIERKDNDPYWISLLENSVADDTLLLNEYDEMIDMLIEGNDNELFVKNIDEPLPVVVFEGENYYWLGKTGSRQYLIKSKGEMGNIILAFVYDEKDFFVVNEMRYASKDSDETWFIIDRRSAINDCESRDNWGGDENQYREELRKYEAYNDSDMASVYYLCINMLPMSLFLRSKKIVLCKNKIINLLGVKMGKKVEPGNEPKFEKITNLCFDILAMDNPYGFYSDGFVGISDKRERLVKKKHGKVKQKVKKIINVLDNKMRIIKH